MNKLNKRISVSVHWYRQNPNLSSIISDNSSRLLYYQERDIESGFRYVKAVVSGKNYDRNLIHQWVMLNFTKRFH